MRHLKLVSSQSLPRVNSTVKLAFASNDRQSVNQHFGAAEAFVVFSVNSETYQLAEVVEFTGEETLKDGQEGKLEAKIQLLNECAAVYCTAVGASAIRQLLATSIQPIKVDAGTAIESLLKDLQLSWNKQPPLWLKRSLRQLEQPVGRFDSMAKQDWHAEEWH